MAFVKVRVPRTSQPQNLASANLSHPVGAQLTTLSVPSGATLRNVVGGAWTPVNSANLSDGVASFGRSVKNASTGYFSRSNPASGSWLSGGIVFTPSTVTGTVGLWSLADTNVSASPNIVVQRNGSDLRIYSHGGYRLTVTGAFSIGVRAMLAWSFWVSTSGTVTASVAINGALYTFSQQGYPVSFSNEFLLSGYNGQAVGDLGLFWSLPTRVDDSQLVSLSQNPWQLFETEEQIIWIPDAVASGPTASMSISTDGSTLVSTASVKAQVSSAISTDASIVSSTASVSAIATAAIATDSATYNAAATSGSIASATLTVDSSIYNGSAIVGSNASASLIAESSTLASSASVSPFAFSTLITDGSAFISTASVNSVVTANLTTASATFSGSAGVGSTAYGSIVADNSIVVSSASVKPIASASINTDTSVFSGFSGVGSTASGNISAENSILASSAFVSPIETANLTTENSVFTSSVSVKPIASASIFTDSSQAVGSAQSGPSVGGSIATDDAWVSAIAKVSPVALMQAYTDGATSAGAASSSTGTVYWPTPSQVLAGIIYGPTGVEYIGTLTAGTVYIEQILSSVVDDKTIVLLQDEVIQSMII